MKIRSLATWGLVFLASAFQVFSQNTEGVDFDGDGKIDAARDSVIVVLQDNVLPDATDESYFAKNQSRADWKNRPARNEFGRLVRRMGAIEGVDSARSLGKNALKSKLPAGKRRQVMALRIDSNKITLKEALKKLSADSAVLKAEPDFIEKNESNDPYSTSTGAWGQSYADQWYLSKIAAPAAWSILSPTAPKVTVAVIDSGVDRSLQDLQNVMWSNSAEIAGNGIDDDKNGYVDDVYGWNFSSANNNTTDTYGHGTLVAGLIAAEQGNSFGIAGAAPGVKIMPLRNGEAGTSYVSKSIEALYYAVNNGASVVNMSFGGANYSEAFAQAIRYALDSGVVLVASAGNSSLESYSQYPSGYQGVISVGATDNLDQIASFSNYGPAVDIVAPGGGGTSYSGQTVLGPRASGTTLGTAVDTYHVRSSGTSFSAPLVTAASALILRQTPSLTPAEIKQILCRSADDLEAAGWSLKTSYGRLNIQRALQTLAPPAADISNVVNGQVLSGAVPVTGTALGSNFTGWRLEYGSGKTPASWTLIAQGSSAVSGTTLGTWQTGSISSGDYTLRLTSTATGRPSGEERLAVFVGNKALPSRTGWPVTGLINAESPVVMDLDGDGVKELIVAVLGGIRVFKADGTAFRVGTYTGGQAWPSGSAAVGDIDGDGEMEIGLISKTGANPENGPVREICFWNLDGTKCTGWPISITRDNDYVPHTLSPTVVDIDGDGVCEVLFPSLTPSGILRLNLVRGNGQPLPGWPKQIGTAPTYVHCTTGAADLDGDGKLDFVVADSSGKVHALNQAGNYLPGWPRTITSGGNMLISQEIALTDLDRDGRIDVIVCFYDGTVAVLDQTGAYKTGWPKNLGSIPRPPAIADLDGDGDLEIAIGTQSGLLHLLQHNGTEMTGWPKQLNNRVYSPCLVDLNNDGRLDIVASDGDRTLHAWNVDGSYFSAFGFPFQLPGTFGCYSAPIVEDLDGDGKLELVVDGDGFEVRSLAAIANPNAPSFTHMHCDAANTCRYVLPGTLSKGQKFLVDRSGGTILGVTGSSLMAGSTVKIGNQNVTVNSVNSSTITVIIPSNLSTGWKDIWVANPNSSPVWLANSVLVVENLFGDTDKDGLSDQWEWKNSFDPLVANAANSSSSAAGDFDGDGISNLIEEVFEPMHFNPRLADAQLLPSLHYVNNLPVFDYSKDNRTQIQLWLAWSPDLVHWYKPGDANYPTSFSDTTLGTVGTIESHRVTVSFVAGNKGFFRWAAKRD